MASSGEPPEDSRSPNKHRSRMPSSQEIKYVYQLPYPVLRELCRVIDYNDKWEELGGTYLGFDIATLYGLRRPAYHGVSGSSPAEVMLSRWGQKDGSLDRLFVYLAHMEFAWAMRVIRPYVSDRVKHLLRDRGCTTVIEEFSKGYGFQQERSSNRGGDSSCFQSGPINSRPSLPPYGNESYVHSRRRSPDSGRQRPPTFPSDFRQNSQFNNCKPSVPVQSPLIQLKVPVEATCSSPSSDVTASLSPQTPSVDNNLDRFEKETAKLPKVDAFPLSSKESSEKIINAEEPTCRVFQIHQHGQHNDHASPRKTSIDSPRINEEGSLQNRRPSDPPNSMPSLLPIVPFKEILAATQDFSSKVLGKGGFGTVFTGNWKNTDVAIKFIRKKDNPGVSALTEAKFKQSMVELRISDCCRHDNILPLYSYSLNDEALCLIYQLMVNGSLEDRLLCKDNSKPLTWLQRCRILRGAACGIQFLHASEPPLIHGDIKSANILLDKTFEAKIGDFGLVREGPPDEKTHMYVDYIHGTRVYLPPEYMRNRQLSTKVDTYSFGVVLFEVATGLRAFDIKRPKSRRSLYEYVHEVDPQKLEQVLRDRKAEDECSELFHIFINMGMDCTNQNRRHRPEMVGVFLSLGNHLNVQEIRSKAVKGKAAEYLNRKDITPYERQLLHDQLKQTEGHPNKEVNNYKIAETKDVAAKSPSPPHSVCIPNRHATEQTIPSSHFPNSYEAESSLPAHSPVCRATNVPTCNLDSCPPTYEEAVAKVHVQPSLAQGDDPQTLQTQSDLYGAGDYFIPNITMLGVKVPLGDTQGNNEAVEYISYANPPVHGGTAACATANRPTVSCNVGSCAGNDAQRADLTGDYYQQQLFSAVDNANFDGEAADAFHQLSLIESSASSA